MTFLDIDKATNSICVWIRGINRQQPAFIGISAKARAQQTMTSEYAVWTTGTGHTTVELQFNKVGYGCIDTGFTYADREAISNWIKQNAATLAAPGKYIGVLHPANSTSVWLMPVTGKGDWAGAKEYYVLRERVKG